MERVSRDQRMFVEINEIFKYMDSKILNKIPSDIREKFGNVKESSYKFEYDIAKTLNEQKISEDTKNMISYLYIKYCCDEENKKDILGKIKANKEREAKAEAERNWLINRKEESSGDKPNVTETALIKKENESIFSKIITKIKNLFGSKNN